MFSLLSESVLPEMFSSAQNGICCVPEVDLCDACRTPFIIFLLRQKVGC